MITEAEPPHDRRASARVLLFDGAGRVLLIRFAVLRAGSEFHFWATPGGTIESGETPREAAGRELFEELGLTTELSGPVHESQSAFEHEGRRVRSTDIFFVGRVTAGHLSLFGVKVQEIRAMRETRWWSARDIEQSCERYFPPELPRLVRSLGSAVRRWAVSDAKAALSQAELVQDAQSLDTHSRDGRLALRLPGDKIAWFPTNEEGRARLIRERQILRLLQQRCRFAAPRLLHEDPAGWDLRSLIVGAVNPPALRERIEHDPSFAYAFGQDLGGILADQHESIRPEDLRGSLPHAPHWPRPEDLPHLPEMVDDPRLLRRIDLALQRRAELDCSEYGPVLVHADIGLHNIVVDPESLRVVGLFDYDGAVLGDRHQDFAYMVFQQVDESMLDGAIAVYEPATGCKIDRHHVLLLNAVAAIGFLGFRHGHSPEEPWCGRTLSQDLAWTHMALARAGL